MEALTKKELLQLLKVTHAASERDWLMVLVGFWHGLRASEICGGWRVRVVKKQKEKYLHPGIRACDVKDGHLTVARAKGSLKTTQALVDHPNVLLSERKALTDFARKAGYPLARLFPIRRQHFWRLMRSYAKLAGIPEHKAHPHVLKHTTATHMIDKAGIQKTRQRLGHKSISSTGVYLEETDANVDAVIVGAMRLARSRSRSR
jgi:site-specific recombinase XerD